MSEQIFVWAGLALLLVLCLPFAAIQKLVLEVYAWGLRLALLALLGGAAYLWFRPEQLPVEVTEALNDFPGLRSILPDPAEQHFGVCAASLVVVVMLPILAALDVCRKLAGGRLRRLRVLSVRAEAAPVQAAPAVVTNRRIDRRAAADILSQAGTRKPSQGPERFER